MGPEREQALFPLEPARLSAKLTDGKRSAIEIAVDEKDITAGKVRIDEAEEIPQPLK